MVRCVPYSSRRPLPARGLTLIEVMIAMFIFLVGIMGVLAAMPTGIDSALAVVEQDAAIHLVHSKFAEFRRDRVDPPTDLIPGSGYLPSGGGYTAGAQEPYNLTSGAPWRDFASDPGQPYEYFDDIKRYEWRVETSPVTAETTGNPAPAAGYLAPSVSGGVGTPLNLTRVTIAVRAHKSLREYTFTQYLCSADPKAK